MKEEILKELILAINALTQSMNNLAEVQRDIHKEHKEEMAEKKNMLQFASDLTKDLPKINSDEMQDLMKTSMKILKDKDEEDKEFYRRSRPKG